MSSGDEPISNRRDDSSSEEESYPLGKRAASKTKAIAKPRPDFAKRVKESPGNVKEEPQSEALKKIKREAVQLKPKAKRYPDESPNSEEDSDDDDSYDRRGSKKRNRRSGRKKELGNIADFVESEASEDDDDLENEAGGYDEKEKQRLKEQYLKRVNPNIPRALAMSDDPEQINKYYEELDEQVDEEEEEIMGVQFPSHTDPNLFSVRCKPGEERQTVASLLRKALAMKQRNGNVTIYSASAIDKMPGYIFVEAYQEKAVRDLCDGLLFINKDLVRVIPKNEVPDLFRPDPTKIIKLKPNTFVRVQNGIYAGDLALVDEIDIGQAAAIVKLIPRLLGAGDDEHWNFSTADSKRPQKKLFNPEEYQGALRLPHNTDYTKLLYTYKGETFENGYVKKRFKIKNLLTENVRPSYEEVQSFRKAEPDEKKWTEISNLQTLANDPNRNLRSMLQKGDRVRVTTGDLCGVQGRAIEVKPDSIQVEFSGDCGIFGLYDLPLQSLEKIYTIGEQIEVINGKYTGKTGSIVNFNETEATFIADDNHEVLPVFLADIRRRVTGSAQQTLLGSQRSGYSKFDLVALNDQKTIGLVMAVQSMSLTIMDLDNFVTTVNMTKVEKKLPGKSFTSNSRNEKIKEKSVIQVIAGPNKGIVAKVIQVHNNRVFIHDSQRREHDGIFVEPADNLLVFENYNDDGHRRNAMNSNPVRRNPERDDGYGGMGQAPPRAPNFRNNPQSLRNQLIGQTKKIIKGEHRGYEGIIQSIIGNKVQFEMSAKGRVITIPLDHLNVNDLEKETIANSNMPSGRTPMFRNPNSGQFNFYNTGTPAYRPFNN